MSKNKLGNYYVQNYVYLPYLPKSVVIKNNKFAIVSTKFVREKLKNYRFETLSKECAFSFLMFYSSINYFIPTKLAVLDNASLTYFSAPEMISICNRVMVRTSSENGICMLKVVATPSSFKLTTVIEWVITFYLLPLPFSN